MNKRISFAVFFLIIVAVMVTVVHRAQPANTLSLEGKWKNVGTTSMGVPSDVEITVDEKFCNIHGTEEMYTLRKCDKGYKLETTDPVSGERTTLEVESYNGDYVVLRQGSSVLELQRVGTADERTCTHAGEEFMRHRMTHQERGAE